MSALRLTAVATVLVLAAGFEARADNYYTPRQFYSGWNSYHRGSYYYRYYYYKPDPTYVGYKHHYVIYYPSKPNYVYYYNPYAKSYWGRCPTHQDGTPRYSLLKEPDRKASLDEIPSKAFPASGPMPGIPEAKAGDDARVDLPPDDLPSEDSLPKK